MNPVANVCNANILELFDIMFDCRVVTFAKTFEIPLVFKAILEVNPVANVCNADILELFELIFDYRVNRVSHFDVLSFTNSLYTFNFSALSRNCYSDS